MKIEIEPIYFYDALGRDYFGPDVRWKVIQVPSGFFRRIFSRFSRKPPIIYSSKEEAQAESLRLMNESEKKWYKNAWKGG